jgi:hypothetical protein
VFMREIRADYDNGAKVIVNLCSLWLAGAEPE